MILETKLVERCIKKLDDEDERAKDIMAAGLLSNYDQYKSWSARRKAIYDCKQIIKETHEEIMKE